MYKIRHYCSHISPNTPRSFLTRLKTRHIVVLLQILDFKILYSFVQNTTKVYTNNPTNERTLYNK